MSRVLIIVLFLLEPVCLATLEDIGDIPQNRDLHRRLLEDRKRRDEAWGR